VGRPLRVLVAHSFYRHRGGEDRYVEDQVKLLSAAGHEVRLYGRANIELTEGASTAASMVYSRRNLQDAVAVLRDFRPEIVHVHNAYPSFGPAIHLAADKEGIPLVMSVHNQRLRCPNGLMFTEGELCSRCVRGVTVHAALHECFPSRRQGLAYGTALWAHRFVLRLEKRVRTFIASSRFMRERLIGWGIPAPRVTYIPGFTSLPDQVQPMKDSQGLFFGRLSEEKGVDTLVHALLAAGDPPFVIAGDGPLGPDLRATVKKLGLRNLTFSGRVDGGEIQRLLDESSFVVAPSISEENAPLSVAEAFAHGRPVVATDIGGLTELAEGRGLLCEPRDVAGLAQQIRRLTGDPGTCRAMGEAARRFAEDELSESTFLRRLEALYSTVA
jgi:glycosyltransferase involved in cell wall biosynthesis